MSKQDGSAEAQNQQKGAESTEDSKKKETTQQPSGEVLSEMFRKGYGEAKEKFYSEGQATAIASIAEATGQEFSSVDDVISFVQANPVAEVTEHDAYKTLQDKYRDIQSKYEQASQELGDLKLSSALRKEVSESLGKTKLALSIDDALSLYKQSNEISVSKDGKLEVKKDGVQIFDEKQNPVTVGDHFTQFVTDRGWVQSNTVGTGGGSGAVESTSNPWASDTLNLTEQGRILRTNPALAKQLKEQANA